MDDAKLVLVRRQVKAGDCRGPSQKGGEKEKIILSSPLFKLIMKTKSFSTSPQG